MSVHEKIPGSGIGIEPATWRDLKDLHQLGKECFQLDAWPLLDVLGVLTIPQVIRLKAVDQEIIVGFIAMDLRRSQQTAWIATLAVMPPIENLVLDLRCYGSARKRLTCPELNLSVRQSNHPAIQLYQKHGYQQIEIWKKYYKGGDNALVFEKLLM